MVNKTYELIEPKIQQKKKNYKNSGILNVLSVRQVKASTFLDYVFGGTEISLIVGIDYTGMCQALLA